MEQNGDVSPAAAPFEPWYQVQVISATKNGENVVFDVNTNKVLLEPVNQDSLLGFSGIAYTCCGNHSYFRRTV